LAVQSTQGAGATLSSTDEGLASAPKRGLAYDDPNKADKPLEHQTKKVPSSLSLRIGTVNVGSMYQRSGIRLCGGNGWQA
jgi:hypothetical protein